MSPSAELRPTHSQTSGQLRPLEQAGISTFGALLIFAGVVLATMLVQLWPVVVTATGDRGASSQQLRLLWGVVDSRVSPETAVLLLVVMASALGVYMHVAMSFGTFVGNRRIEPRWLWSYVFQLSVGVGLALVFYFAVRGAFFDSDATPAVMNPFGIAAVSGLIGLFSRQVSDKLREVFDTLFETQQSAGETVASSVLAAIEGPPLLNYSGWLSIAMVDDAAGHVEITEDRRVRLVPGRPHTLRVGIGAEPGKGLGVPLQITGGVDADEVEFSVEIDSDRPPLRRPPQKLVVDARSGTSSVEFPIRLDDRSEPDTEDAAESPWLWIRVAQQRRVVQNVELVTNPAIAASA